MCSRTALHRRLRLHSLAALLWALAAGVQAADLTAYTEEWAPYNFSEGGEIKGIGTEMLRAACAEARLSCDIHIVPWARAYALALNTPDTLVYTTARKPFREKSFVWIGPILPRTTWVWGRAAGERNGIVKTVRDLPQLRFGVVRGDATVQELLDAGVPQAQLMADSSNGAALRLLHSGWVDAMVDTEIGMAWTLRMAGLPASTVQPLIPLSEDAAYYFALNPQSKPGLAPRLQRALDTLRKSGKLDAIVKAYRPASLPAATPAVP